MEGARQRTRSMLTLIYWLDLLLCVGNRMFRGKVIFKQETCVVLSLGFVDTLVEKEASTSRRSGSKIGEISPIPKRYVVLGALYSTIKGPPLAPGSSNRL